MAFVAQDMQTGADAYSLGTLTAEYKTRQGAAVLRAIIGFIMAVLGVFGALYAIFGYNVSSDDQPGIIILAALGIFIGWVLIEAWISRRNFSVQVFTDGLVRKQFGKTVVVRWDEIISVWQAITKHYTNGIYTGTTHLYTVQKTDGTKTKYNDGLRNVEQLGNTIQDQVTRRLLPPAMAVYNGGGTVSFGKLSISPMGLAWGDKSLTWAEIEGVQISKGYLTVKKQGKWLRWANIPVASLPNMIIAFTMVDRIVGLKTSK